MTGSASASRENLVEWRFVGRAGKTGAGARPRATRDLDVETQLAASHADLAGEAGSRQGVPRRFQPGGLPGGPTASSPGLQNVLRDREDGTDDILKALVALTDRPWVEYGRKAKPLSARQLAALLKPFGVKPGSLKFHGADAKGYAREALGDAFSRYLPTMRRGVADDVFPDNPSENPRRQDTGATATENGSVAGFSRENQGRDEI